jgi:hypothetical protein
MKKACNFSVAGFSVLVRLAGIEPTTPWFVAKYSIQLSYSREERNCSMTFCGSAGSRFRPCRIRGGQATMAGHRGSDKVDPAGSQIKIG